MNGEINVTYGVFRRAILSYLGVRIQLLRLFGVVVLVGGTWTHFREHAAGLPWQSLLAGAVIIAIPEVLTLLIWLASRRRVAGLNRFVVTATGLEVTRPSGQQRLEWRDVARVQRGLYAWSVRPAGAPPVVLVPRRAFSAADQTTINDFFLRHPEFTG